MVNQCVVGAVVADAVIIAVAIAIAIAVIAADDVDLALSVIVACRTSFEPLTRRI